MTLSAVRVNHREDDICVLTLDAPGRSANTMDDAYWEGMDAALDELNSTLLSGRLRGVVVISAKKTFFAGGDLRMLRDIGPSDAPEMTTFVRRVKNQLRALETLGVPVVAAVNGSALGGGLEIALACHARVVVDSNDIRLGLPEVTLGLLPAANGLIRTVRLLGVRRALGALLISGGSHTPGQALELGFVDALVASADDLLPWAVRWINQHPQAAAPWDLEGFRLPEAELGHDREAVVASLPSAVRRLLDGYPMPAPHAILEAACAGAEADFDTASQLESAAFVELVTGPVATNLIQSRFFDLQTIRSGGSRPAGIERFTPTRVGVIGAGMMGAGIAQSSAAAGLDVVLVNIDLPAADRGLASIRKSLHRALVEEAEADAVLARIQPSGEIADVSSCDVVVEAVHEDSELKEQIFKDVEASVAETCLLASNTSTLPITGLAASLARPDRFVGLHFFSPVPRMELVEVIAGAQTSDETLAHGLDVVRALRKVPIVVSDSRGFFTSRVILTRLVEAMAMVGEGVAPERIDRVAVEAGYPVGPLALLDELTLSLTHSIRSQTRAAALEAGTGWDEHPGDTVLAELAVDRGRLGRAAGGGFYDYVDGRRTGLWPGLATYADPVGGAIADQEVADRLLYAESVDSLRCLEEGVLRSTADANVGSLLGIGYPSWTGGVVQHAAGNPGGPDAFRQRADELAAAHGPRFALPATWLDHVGGSSA